MSQDFPCVDQRCRPRAPRTAASVASSSEDPFHSEALPQNAQGEHEQMKLEIEMAQGKLQPKATDWSLQVSPPVLQYNLMHYPVLVRPANLSIPLKSRKSRAAWMPGGLTRPLRLVEIERERARERERVLADWNPDRAGSTMSTTRVCIRQSPFLLYVWP